MWSIDKLKFWDENPRIISNDEYQLLKKKIERFGQFKPIIIKEDGTVLGGNMRLRAYQELGIEKVWVSIVHPKDEAEAIEIALTDNELAGRWVPDLLTDLLSNFPTIELNDYKLDLGKAEPLDKLSAIPPVDLSDVPTATDVVKEKEMICPHCGKTIHIVV